MTDALAAEWLKLRTVRSTWLTLLVVAGGVLAGAALSWYVAGVWDGAPPNLRPRVYASSMEVLAEMVAQMSLAVLGVLAVTTEYGTGMIRTTLTALPRRGRLLAAKAVLVGGISWLAGTAAIVATFLADKTIIGDRPIAGRSGPLAEELGRLLASGLGVAAFALVALGLGVVTRSTAGAIAVMAALWYVLPIVALNLPQPWGARLYSVLPSMLAAQVGGASTDGLLSPAAALAVMAAWPAAALGAAAFALCRRDA